jgi:hypothetical protein
VHGEGLAGGGAALAGGAVIAFAALGPGLRWARAGAAGESVAL